MVSLRSERQPVNPLKTVAKAMCIMIAAGAGGCASQSVKAPSWAMGGAPAQPSVVSEQTRRYDLEEDGIEAQIPPPPSIRAAPDDPSEPFSPNYGSRPAGAEPSTSAPPPATRPSNPPGLKGPVRPRFASAQTD